MLGIHILNKLDSFIQRHYIKVMSFLGIILLSFLYEVSLYVYLLITFDFKIMYYSITVNIFF